MSKENVFQLRLEPGTREEIDEQAADQGITTSEWIRDAIEVYLNMDQQDMPSKEELEDMDWDELCEVIDENKLGTNPDDYDNSGIFSSPDDDDTEELCKAIALELIGELEEVLEEELEEE